MQGGPTVGVVDDDVVPGPAAAGWLTDDPGGCGNNGRAAGSDEIRAGVLDLSAACCCFCRAASSRIRFSAAFFSAAILAALARTSLMAASNSSARTFSETSVALPMTSLVECVIDSWR